MAKTLAICISGVIKFECFASAKSLALELYKSNHQIFIEKMQSSFVKKSKDCLLLMLPLAQLQNQHPLKKMQKLFS